MQLKTKYSAYIIHTAGEVINTFINAHRAK